jgi:hypothetical protein
MRKSRVNFTFTSRAKKLLEKLSLAEGMSQSAYLEMVIRDVAKKQGVTVTQEEEAEDEGDD